MPKPSVALWSANPAISLPASAIPPAVTGTGERLVDDLRGAGDDVPEDEEQDPGRECREERPHAGGQAADPPERKSEEDRAAGDRAEKRRLPGAHAEGSATAG